METIPVIFFSLCLFFPCISELALSEKLHEANLDPPEGRPFTLWSVLTKNWEQRRGNRKKEGEENKTETQVLIWKFFRTYSPGLETISSLFFFFSSQFSFMEQHFSSSPVVRVSFLTFLSKGSPRKWMLFYLWQQ